MNTQMCPPTRKYGSQHAHTHTHTHTQTTNKPQKIYELNESANLVNQTKRKHNNQNTFVHEY